MKQVWATQRWTSLTFDLHITIDLIMLIRSKHKKSASFLYGFRPFPHFVGYARNALLLWNKSFDFWPKHDISHLGTYKDGAVLFRWEDRIMQRKLYELADNPQCSSADVNQQLQFRPCSFLSRTWWRSCVCCSRMLWISRSLTFCSYRVCTNPLRPLGYCSEVPSSNPFSTTFETGAWFRRSLGARYARYCGFWLAAQQRHAYRDRHKLRAG